MCTSTKIKRTCETVYEQLGTIRAKLIKSQQELEEIQSVPKITDFFPDKVEQVFEEQHGWSTTNVKYSDDPIFNGDLFAELKVWLDKQAVEPQEAHLPISNTSEYIFVIIL